MINSNRRGFIGRVAVAAVPAMLVAGVIFSGSDATGLAHGSSVTASAAPVFTFGHERDNLHPLMVTIYDTGAVAATSGLRARTWTPRGRLSKDALDGLLKLAQAEGFFTMPRSIVGKGPANSSGRFISIRTGATTQKVSVRLARNVGFDQLYAVLLAAADVIGDAPPGELSADAYTPPNVQH